MKRLLHKHIVIDRVRNSALFKHINNNNPKEKNALQARTNTNKKSSLNKKRVEFRARSASLTIEASIVIPIFLFFAITFLSFISLTKSELSSQIQLDNKVRSMSRYTTFASLTDEVYLSDHCKWNFPYFPGDAFGIDVYEHCKSRAWVGAKINESTDEQIVYVTETGTVYHKIPGCTHIKLSIETTTYDAVKDLRNSYGGKYSPCEKCGKGAKYAGVLYITETGDRYHTSIKCSGLKRSVTGIKISEVGERGKCSRCWN